MSERESEAYADLGGRIPSQPLDAETERALYNAGIGSREMRARVEAQIQREQDAAQHEINKTGAQAFRDAVIEQDRARGIDVTSVAYLAKLRLDERRRTRRA